MLDPGLEVSYNRHGTDDPCRRWYFSIEDPRKSGGWSAYSSVRRDQLVAGISKHRDSDKGDMFLCINRNVSGGWAAWMPPDELRSLSLAFGRVPRFSVVLNDKDGNPLVDQIDVILGKATVKPFASFDRHGNALLEPQMSPLGCDALKTNGWIAGTSKPPMIMSVSPYIRLREMDVDWEDRKTSDGRRIFRSRTSQIIGESVDVIARFQVPVAVKEQVLARAVTGSVSPKSP